MNINLCVFCGSRLGDDIAYQKCGYEFGKRIAEHGNNLVYGAGSIGIMGEVAQGCLDAGGKVTGVIPEFLIEKEKPATNLTELIVTETMSERKDIMMEKADAYAVLPGGFGTMEEFFQTLVANQITSKVKPLGILNVNGYYDQLIHLINEIIQHGFADKHNASLFVVANTIEEFIYQIESYSPKIAKEVAKQDDYRISLDGS